MLESDGYPKPWPLFWTAAAVAVAWLVGALAWRWRIWARGMGLPAGPRGRGGSAVVAWLVEVFGQRRLRRLSRLRWAAHLGIFWGFLALGLLSALHVLLRLLAHLKLDGGLADWFFSGDGRAALKAWGNVSGLVLLAGLLLGLARRVIPRTDPAADSREADARLLLFLLWLTVSGFLLEALRGAAGSTPAAAAALSPWLTALWTLHGLSGVALVALLPHSTLLHGLLAPLVIALEARAEHARKDFPWDETAKNPAPGSPKG